MIQRTGHARSWSWSQTPVLPLSALSSEPTAWHSCSCGSEERLLSVVYLPCQGGPEHLPVAVVTSRHWITQGCGCSGLWGGGWILAQDLWSWQGHSVQHVLPFSSPLLGACAASQLGTAVSLGHTQNSDQSMSTHMYLACCGRNLFSQNMCSFFSYF